MSDVHYKVYCYGTEGALVEIRRGCHQHTTVARWPDVSVRLSGLLGHDSLRLEYEDTEKDRVVLDSQDEWEECLRAGPYTTANPLRLHITKRKADKDSSSPESPKRSRKDKEHSEPTLAPTEQPPEPPTASTTTPASSSVRPWPAPPVTPLASTFKSTMKEVLDIVRRYVKVTNMEAAPPDWLASAVNIAPPNAENPQEVELDVNLLSFAAALQTQALTLMEAHRFDEALALLTESHAVRPRKETVYNVACCMTLMGQVDKALEALEQAIMMGYTDHNHLLQDEDLAALRSHPRFTALVAWLQESGIALGSVSSSAPNQAEQTPAQAPPATPERKQDNTVAAATDAAAPAQLVPAAPFAPAAPAGPAAVETPAAPAEATEALQAAAPVPVRQQAEGLGEASQFTTVQQAALLKLHELGFTSDDANVNALRTSNWALPQAVNLLLELSMR